MNNVATISVLMPIYNARKYLSLAIDSILSQTFQDIELIAIDDGSTDGSTEILKSYADSDPRVKAIFQQNMGYVVAMQNGYKNCNSAIIARMDADDICLPNRIERQLSFLNNNPDYLVVGSLTIYIDESGQEIGMPHAPTDHAEVDSWHMSGRGCALCHPTAMFRKAAFDSLGGYRRDFEPAEDFDLWVRMSEVGRIALLPERLVKYRIHAESVSRKRASAQDYAIWRSVREAIIRRKYPLSRVPFYDLGPDEQVNWIDMALDLRQGSFARKWAMHRLLRIRSVPAIKQYAKSCLSPWLSSILPLYDRFLGRQSTRSSPFDRNIE